MEFGISYFHLPKLPYLQCIRRPSLFTDGVGVKIKTGDTNLTHLDGGGDKNQAPSNGGGEVVKERIEDGRGIKCYFNTMHFELFTFFY